MTLEELQKENESLRGQIARAHRGEGDKWLLGLVARGIWELAEQVCELTHEIRMQPRAKVDD